MPEQTAVRDEIAAMRRIVAAVEDLDPEARRRVIGWAADRYTPGRWSQLVDAEPAPELQP